eukprot:g2107.t1
MKSINELSAHQLALRGDVIVLRARYAAIGPEFISCFDDSGESPLHTAARHDQAAVARALVEEMRAPVNEQDRWGRTPLHVAAHHDSVAAAKVLLGAAAEAEATMDTGWTAAHVAARADSTGVLRALREAGANLDAAGAEEGERPVHVAVALGRALAVRTLKELGADMDGRNARGETAVHLCASMAGGGEGVRTRSGCKDGKGAATAPGHLGVVMLKLLHECGATLSVQDDRKRTAAHAAAAAGDVRILDTWLQLEGCKPSAARRQARRGHAGRHGGMFLPDAGNATTGAQLSIPGTERGRKNLTQLSIPAPLRTLAHCAAFAGQLACLEWLHEAGFPVVTVDEEGETPLHKAAQGDSVECVEYLVGHAVRMEQRDLHGETAAQVAKRVRSNAAFLRLGQLEEEALKQRQGKRKEQRARETKEREYEAIAAATKAAAPATEAEVVAAPGSCNVESAGCFDPTTPVKAPWM